MNASFPNFDRTDFFRRWKLARFSALKAATNSILSQHEDEFSILNAVSHEHQSEVLKQIFLHSRKLADSLTGHFKMVFELSELLDLFRSSDFRCLSGQWESEDNAAFLNRNACHEICANSSFQCLYAKEAIDGLTLGLTEDIRFSRHKCVSSGDTVCLDAFYHESSQSHRYGKLDETVAQEVPRLVTKFGRLGMQLMIEGQSEQTIYYRLVGLKRPLCGPSADMFHQLFKDEVSKQFPSLKTKDASPLAVFSDSQQI